MAHTHAHSNRDNLRHAGARRAFTIVEMLVVCAIIMLLLSILLPSFARARYDAKLIHCASNFSQWGVGTLAYASDYNRCLPSQNFGSSGRVVWDISHDFLPSVIPYGITWQPNGRSVWYCPLQTWFDQNAKSQEDALQMRKDMWAAQGENWDHHNQLWWVPRQSGGKWYPYLPGDAKAAPLRLSDPGTENPILTERNKLKTVDANNRERWSNHHMWDNQIESTTLLFVDGHVAFHRGEEMQVRYIAGGWANFY